MRKKAAKGTVVVQSYRDNLRLVWTYKGERKFLYLGLPDTALNRSIATQKANQIYQDIVTGHYDPTLLKYKSEQQIEVAQAKPKETVAELFAKFTEWKKPQIEERTWVKYLGLQNHIEQYFGQKPARSIDDSEAWKFADYLKEKLRLITVKERIGMLKACWIWGIRRKLVEDNPWVEVKIKVPPQQPESFTLEEMQAILKAIGESQRHRHYADFVEFLFGTGCRIGEAAGLRWQHVAEDCSYFWIGEIWTRGKRQPVKKYRARTVRLTPRLQQLLLKLRSENSNPDDPVFRSPTGKMLDDHNFRNRVWVPLLKELNIGYKKPHTTRKTHVTAALKKGQDPAVLAEQTGHSQKVLFKNYAGLLESTPKLTDILPDLDLDSQS